MITRLSHASIYVLNPDEAKQFYTEKLGLEVRVDQTANGFRWLTVGPADQPDVELVLMPVAPSSMMDETTVDALREMITNGVFGCGVLKTKDCQRTYKELTSTSKGVEFIMPPTDRPWGKEALFKDNSGNWFSMSEE